MSLRLKAASSVSVIVFETLAVPETVNVVITGRDAPAPIVELADTVTEMREVKHAYREGIRAKRGIDY